MDSDFHPRAAGASTATCVDDHLAAALSGRWESRLGRHGTLICGAVTVEFELGEDARTVALKSIWCHPAGTGIGTAVIEAMKEYADHTGKDLLVEEIENDRFFDRFPFWTERFYADDAGPSFACYSPGG